MTARTRLPSDPMVAMFAGAAGRAAIFELKVRMVADAVALPGAVAKALDELVKDVVAWMVANGKGTAEEHERIRRCARIRNKLFHLELSRVTGQLVSLDVRLREEGVSAFTWEGDLTAEKLMSTIAGGDSPVGMIATAEGGIFAWLLQSSASGAFGAAARVFDEAADSLERALPGFDAEGDEDGGGGT